MDDAQFVEQSVALQLGEVLKRKLCQSSETATQALAGASGSALLWLTAEGRPDPRNGWRMKKASRLGDPEALERIGWPDITKAQGALRSLLAAGLRSDILIDMQDRRLRNLALPNGELLPNISFNRELGSDQRILWPLPRYHDLDSAAFLGPSNWSRVPWSEKKERVVWRGTHGGRPDPHGDVRREGLRLKPLLRRFENGKIDQNQAARLIDTFPRHRIVNRYIDDPRFDVGFTGAQQNISLKSYPFIRNLIRPRLTQQEMLFSKYLLVLRGLDVGSSFYWTMNSGSVGLVMETYFESFASGHFRPWEHYVPFKANLSDFEERLDWCRSNDAECEKIAQRSQDVCRWLARGDLREEIAREVVAKLNNRVE